MHKHKIIQLRKEGKTYNQIQKEIGCSKGTISYHLGHNQKQKNKERSQKRREMINKIIANIKEDSGCKDCNTKYPYFVLEFDHIKGKKVGDISKMTRWYPIEIILEEIKKCEVVCANCHRFRSHERNKKIKK
jgi:DNA-binding CsgD family transcriptional regulator